MVLLHSTLEGISLGGIASGIKKSGNLDLMLAKMPKGSMVAGAFTRSTTAAPSVKRCRDLLNNPSNSPANTAPISGLVVNSGNANVFGGDDGEQALAKMVSAAAAALGCDESEVFAASTGVIGEPLAVDVIAKAMPKLAQNLTPNQWETAAKAIMTTDTHPKTAFKKLSNGVQIVAIAKGAGMIAPNMATMLAFIFTDGKVANLHQAISEATEQSFNRITIDSDTSTSDSVLLVATNQKPLAEEAEFKTALNQLCLELAHQIIKDGEGAKKFIQVNVSEAKSLQDAKTLAFSVANSPLVKIALGAGDPNWGRIIMALGKTTIELKRKKIIIALNKLVVAQNGARANFTEATARKLLAKQTIEIDIQLGLGEEKCTVWTSDFNNDYVRINADYRT